jgi:hypothetical protein
MFLVFFWKNCLKVYIFYGLLSKKLLFEYSVKKYSNNEQFSEKNIRIMDTLSSNFVYH